jgi:hypothetical protein
MSESVKTSFEEKEKETALQKKMTSRLAEPVHNRKIFTAVSNRKEDCSLLGECEVKRSPSLFYELFANDLKYSQNLSQHKYRLNIPHTIMVSNSNFLFWFFTSKDGLVLKKNKTRFIYYS